MNFAVGYKHRSEGERFSSLVLSYDSIGEVYFPWVDEPSGRPVLGYGEGDDAETVKSVLIGELTDIRRGGRKLDLLLNANCYGELAMSHELECHVRGIIGDLDTYGCKPDIVTAASPFVAHAVKRHYPEIETRASVNMRLTTLQAMRYLAPLFDSFYIGRDVQRNLDTLREFSAWAHSEGKKLGLLANSGCLRNCPWQTYHDNLVAHSAAALNHTRAEKFNPHLCWTLYQDSVNFPEILKATWVRPEDISLYAPYVDFIKLATRQHSLPRVVVNAYDSQCYQGNLLDLFEPGYTPAFARKGVYLNNMLFPSDWAEKSSRCFRECTECGYCEKVFETISK